MKVSLAMIGRRRRIATQKAQDVASQTKRTIKRRLQERMMKELLQSLSGVLAKAQ